MANRYVSHSTHTVFVGHRMWVLSVAPCLSKNTKSTTHAKRWQGRVKPNLAGPDREKLQGGFFDLFDLFFRQFSVYFRTKIRKQIP